MVRLLDGLYAQGQRSESLMKVKVADYNEFAFQRFTLGQRGVQDLLAVCVTEAGIVFDATMVGTVEEKEELYNSVRTVGEPLTIKHYGFTDAGKPRCLTGIGFRDYE